MEIKKINSKNFTSRNKTIRIADNIARRVNTNSPRISSSIVEGLKFADERKFLGFRKNLCETITLVRLMQSQYFNNSKDFVDRIKALIVPIKIHKAGNCGEAAILAQIATKTNGIKNSEIRYLITPDNQRWDHAIVYVNDKKPYIIDSWLGFADYVPNAIEKYKKDFRQYFDFEEKGSEKMLCAQYSKDYKIIRFLNENYSEEKIKILQENFPDLVVKK